MICWDPSLSLLYCLKDFTGALSLIFCWNWNLFFIKRWELKTPTLSPWHTQWPPLPGLSRGLFRGPPFRQPHGSPQIINIYSVTGGIDTRTWLPALPSLLCIPVVGFIFCRRELFSHWRTLSFSRFRNSSIFFINCRVIVDLGNCSRLPSSYLKLFIPNGSLVWHTSFDTVSIPNGMTSKQVININSFPVRFYFRVSVPNYYKTLQLRNKKFTGPYRCRD